MNNGLAHYFSPARTLKSRGGPSPQRPILSPQTAASNNPRKKNNFMINFEDKAEQKEPETGFKLPHTAASQRKGVLDSIEGTLKGLPDQVLNLPTTPMS
jgi:hypothetical protein